MLMPYMFVLLIRVGICMFSYGKFKVRVRVVRLRLISDSVISIRFLISCNIGWI
jgi:hypothetical protein